MIPALPYIILAIFSTIAIVLYIAGCAVTHNWWPLFGILMQIAAIIFFILFTSRIQASYVDEESWFARMFTEDSTIFFGVLFQSSAIGLVSIFFHCDTISRDCFLMQFFGDVALIIGFIVYVYLKTRAAQVYAE